jgi:hypothetical protein
MEIFKLNSAQFFPDGELLNEIESIMWVERYLDAGEFSIKAPATEELRQKLLPGTFLSHTDTLEIMMVESQIIDETKEGELKLEVSGRSIEAVLMENRLVTNFIYTHQNTLHEYQDDPYPSNFTDPFYTYRPSSWGHVKYLIDKYVGYSTSSTFDSLTAVIYDDVPSGRWWDPELTYYEGFAKKLSNVYTNVKELLGSTNSGIKVVRDRSLEYDERIKFVVHQGQLKDNVVFSFSAGDLESVRYLWQFEPWLRCYVDSTHAAFVYPTEYPVYPSVTYPNYPPGIPDGQWKLNLKAITADAGDTEPYHNDNTVIHNILENVANLEIAKNKKRTIIDAKASKNPKYKYKLDYDIGDLVNVVGNYEASQLMRVVEHALILDETGETSIPTFAPLY